MSSFQVPQFIEIEDKIFGPLTFKQFVYVAGGAGIAFLFWAYIPVHFIAVLFIIPTVAFALLLAFYKINNRPFILALEAVFRYSLNRKLFIWKRVEKKPALGVRDEGLVKPSFQIPKLSESKLKDLSWSLDIKEKIR